MPVRAVFLVGFMASGKSSVGRELARRLGWDFVDLDALVESREHLSISNIFRERGEAAFRAAESRALHDLTTSMKRDTVVALGGGTFVHPGNREMLQSWPSVFLDVPLDELWNRCVADATKRPLHTSDRAEFARLYDDRRHSYSQATVTVVTRGSDPASLCLEIERRLLFQGATESLGIQNSSIHIKTGESK